MYYKLILCFSKHFPPFVLCCVCSRICRFVQLCAHVYEGHLVDAQYLPGPLSLLSFDAESSFNLGLSDSPKLLG